MQARLKLVGSCGLVERAITGEILGGLQIEHAAIEPVNAAILVPEQRSASEAKRSQDNGEGVAAGAA